MKRIDLLLVKSFIPPFLLSFLIALFVLVMQTLFIYLDDFVGKGLGLFVIVEMIFYLSIKLFPLALAIGVLLASVMVFGNMGEKYELSSFKSAGVSLFRIMRSLIFLVTLISIFSYLCNDFLNPKANLQFHSRMWDIRRQKPSLSIEERMFNNDFFGFSIWIDRKLADDRGIEGVLVYNQANNTNDIDVISAKNGEMYTDESGRYFIMSLNDGVKYSEQYKESKNGKLTYPFMRTQFKSWNKAFDLNEFELGMTDQDLFKSHHYMRSSIELIADIDSFQYKLSGIRAPLDTRFMKLLDIPPPKNNDILLEERDELMAITDSVPLDTVSPITDNFTQDQLPKENQIVRVTKKIKKSLDTPSMLKERMLRPDTTSIQGRLVLSNKKGSLLGFNVDSLFSNTEKRSILSIASTSVRNLQYDITKSISEEKRLHINLAKFQFELHSKFSLAIACFIFLFIGAPMGAIIRKGGFGYPLLVSIIFFALYIVASIAMKKMSETLKVDAILGAWLPTMIIFAIGLFLTIKAKNDSKMMDVDMIRKKLVTIFNKYLAKVS